MQEYKVVDPHLVVQPTVSHHTAVLAREPDRMPVHGGLVLVYRPRLRAEIGSLILADLGIPIQDTDLAALPHS